MAPQGQQSRSAYRLKGDKSMVVMVARGSVGRDPRLLRQAVEQLGIIDSAGQSVRVADLRMPYGDVRTPEDDGFGKAKGFWDKLRSLVTQSTIVFVTWEVVTEDYLRELSANYVAVGPPVRSFNLSHWVSRLEEEGEDISALDSISESRSECRCKGFFIDQDKYLHSQLSEFLAFATEHGLLGK